MAMNILLVDDSKTSRVMQKHALTPIAPALLFFEANDGVEALAVIAANRAGFDLMLVDWNMPNMDGLQLITKIRETDRKTPIIMVTTEGERGHVLDAIKAGASSYVVKPFSAAALLAKAQQMIVKPKAA
jgi:two-component system chemotaxis response regulator CheY